MKFAKGMLGATIIVIALVTTTLFGFVGGIEQESATQYKYSGNTDITNLYNYEQVLNYTDYNPTSNWTGYNGDIAFTELPDTASNQYIFRYYYDSEWVTVDLKEDGRWVHNSYGYNYFYVTYPDGAAKYLIKSTVDNWISYVSLDKVISTEAKTHGFTIDLSGMTNVVIVPSSWEYEYLADGYEYVFHSLQEPNQSEKTIRKPMSIDYDKSTETATIYFDSNGTQFVSGLKLSDLRVYFGGEIYDQPYSTSSMLTDTNKGAQWDISDYWRLGGSADTEYESWATITGNNEVWYCTSVKYHRLFGAGLEEFGKDLPYTITFDLTSRYAPFIVGADDFRMESESVFHAESKWVKTATYTKSTDKWTLTYYDGSTYTGYAYVIYNGNIQHYTGMKLDQTLTTYVKPLVTTKYMDISQGVQLSGTTETGSATWVNGYHTGTVDILISGMAKRNASYTFTFGQAVQKDIGLGLGINNYVVSNTEEHTITVSSTSNTSPYYVLTVDGVTYDIGTWRAVLLSIDPQNSRIAATPVYSVTSFVDYSVRSNSIVVPMDFSKDYIDWFNVTGTTNNATYGYSSLKFGVVNTSVWEDEYGQLMSNPTIDVGSLYPNLIQSGVRLSFTDAAKFGDSVTIGSTTYPIDNGYIVTDYGRYELQYITIDIYSDYTQINLGSEYAIVIDGAPVITFNGSWYFQTYLSEYSTGTVKYDNWKVGEWDMDENTTILVFAGMCVIGLVMSMMVYGIRTLDLIVVISSIIVSISIIG